MFVLLVDFTAPMEEVGRLTPAHRAHLGTWYDAGRLLFSGRLNPVTGGVILATGTREEVDRLIAEDPFVIEGVAAYTVVEFDPNRAADDVREALTSRGVELP